MTTTNTPAARRGRGGDGRRVELWLRAPSVWTDDRRAGLIGRLERLESAGWLDDVEVRTWGAFVDPAARPQTDYDAVVRNRVEAFRAWARRTGRALPGFETERTWGAGRMGEERTVVRLPPVTLAAYRGDAVEWVAPAADPDGLHTTSEWIAAAERRAFGTPVDARPGDRNDRTRRPTTPV